MNTTQPVTELETDDSDAPNMEVESSTGGDHPYIAQNVLFSMSLLERIYRANQGLPLPTFYNNI